MKHKLSGKTVEISFDSEWEAEQFNLAIELNQWIKFLNGTFAVRDPKDGTPDYTDVEKLIANSCQPIFGKTPELLPCRSDDPSYSALYVQHICGYDSKIGGYKWRFNRLREAGFELLRSVPKEGKYWEIWYLWGERAATGPIKDMKLEEVVRWLYHEIGPGNVSTDYKRWALGAPD